MCGVILENRPFFQQMFSDHLLHQRQMLQMDMMESFWGPDHVLNIFCKCSGMPVVSFKPTHRKGSSGSPRVRGEVRRASSEAMQPTFQDHYRPSIVVWAVSRGWSERPKAEPEERQRTVSVTQVPSDSKCSTQQLNNPNAFPPGKGQDHNVDAICCLDSYNYNCAPVWLLKSIFNATVNMNGTEVHS